MNNITELVFILDRSGSMAGLESDTIGGFNAMLKKQKKERGWEFLFLGANIDAVETARSFGIGADRAVNYHCDSRGTALNYQAINEAVCCVRMAQPLTAAWKNCVEDDFENREGR